LTISPFSDTHNNKFPETEKTEVLQDNDRIVKRTLETFSSINETLDACLDHAGPFIHTIEPIWRELNQLKEKGVRIRCITEITSENISYCKRIKEIAVIRHMNGVRSNFGIADRKQCLLHGISHETQPLSQAIITNAKGIVEAQQTFFESLWCKAIPSEQRINEIEEGVKPSFIKSIRDTCEIQKLGFELIGSAKVEILLILSPSTINSLSCSKDCDDLVQLLEVAALQDAEVRILISPTGADDRIKEIITQKLKSKNRIEIQYLSTILQTEVTTLIVDMKFCLTVELKEEDGIDANTYESMGVATYTNNESIVWSYISVFESLWIQTRSVKTSQY
jgi:hypothetical protein